MCEFDKFNYVVIRSDRTFELEKNGKYYHIIRDTLIQKVDCDVELIFAFDDKWGSGLYEIGEDLDEIYHIFNMVKQSSMFTSEDIPNELACFRCTSKNYHHLKSIMNYVDCFHNSQRIIAEHIQPMIGRNNNIIPIKYINMA